LLPLSPVAAQMPLAVRALQVILFFFGLVRALVVSGDLYARDHQAYSSTILRDLVALLLYGIVVLVVLRTVLAVDVTPLLATSALVTAVIGLALQETLGNVFSGLSLQLQKPFEPGDWIRFQGTLGRVLGIGWRSTRLVTRELTILDVPNALLAKEPLTNYRGQAIGDELFVATSYDAPPNRVKEVIHNVLREEPRIVRTPPPQVWVVDYGDFAIKYRIRFWMSDYAQQDPVRDSVMTHLWYAFRRNGIEIPYPIRSLYMHEVEKEATRPVPREEWIAGLRGVDFLRELDDEELAVLLPSLHAETYGEGEVICYEGEPGETFYAILEGAVDVVARRASGEEIAVATLRKPSFFGEMSLLTGEARSATVRARGDVRLLVVERAGFEALFQSKPSVAEAISRVLAERQSELRQRREAVSSGEAFDPRKRLLARMRSIFRF
jgi:small-conductance mechanosensitive channel/CRP-like cAMP-binding protein